MSRISLMSKFARPIALLTLSCLTGGYFLVWLPLYAVAGVLFSHPYDNTLHWTAVGLLMAIPGVILAGLWWWLLRRRPQN
jgi:hypothetical protein